MIIIILYPLTKILNFIVSFILKLVGVDYKDSSKEEILEKSEEELRGAIDLHGKNSTGNEEKQMLKSILDLDYNEDSAAQVDANFVICDSDEISEIQVTGEEFFFNDNQFAEMFSLAKIGVKEIISKQKEALK